VELLSNSSSIFSSCFKNIIEAEILASPPYRRADMAHDVGKRNAVHKPDEASG